MTTIRFQSLHITHRPQQAAVFEVRNDYCPSVTVNDAHVGDDDRFKEGLYTMQPRPLIAFSLITALAGFVTQAASMIPNAGDLQRLLHIGTSDVLMPQGATTAPHVDMNTDEGHAQLTLQPLKSATA